MRRLIFVVVCGMLAAAGGPVCADEAQPEGDPSRDPFNLDWWTIDGGGGPAAGGDFELLATIGQADVGTAIGDDYLLQSGFLAGGDLGILFVDGFDSGTTGRWDDTVGGALR